MSKKNPFGAREVLKTSDGDFGVYKLSALELKLLTAEEFDAKVRPEKMVSP